jgi:hypothetical protein
MKEKKKEKKHTQMATLSCDMKCIHIRFRPDYEYLQITETCHSEDSIDLGAVTNRWPIQQLDINKCFPKWSFG